MNVVVGPALVWCCIASAPRSARYRSTMTPRDTSNEHRHFSTRSLSSESVRRPRAVLAFESVDTIRRHTHNTEGAQQ
jgi:hypothetical protein